MPEPDAPPIPADADETAATDHAASIPLCVDLDGSLVATDTLWESCLQLVQRNPLALLSALKTLSDGRAAFKQRVSDVSPVDPTVLPYRPEVLTIIEAAREEGRPVWLATGADVANARAVADHLGLFDGVSATNDGSTDTPVNNVGPAKLDALRAHLGDVPFDYVGDSTQDLALWKAARTAYTVGAASHHTRDLRDEGVNVHALVPDRTSRWGSLFKAIRPHQWAKNLLLLLPMMTGMAVGDLSRWALVIPAIAAFCLAGSAVYLTNDLIDLPADRQHPRKSKRPLAAGKLPIPWALLAIPVCLLGAFVVAGLLSWKLGSSSFVAVVAVYLVTAMSYALHIKGIAMLDVICLALLYVLRIIAGGIAVGLFPTAWLLAFGSFLFLSLAFAKRYSELAMILDRGDTQAAGRNYRTDDIPLVMMMGVIAGYLSVLVLAFYINRDLAGDSLHEDLYAHPERLWLVTPIMLYWISRLWFRAHRRTLRGDPLLFAMSDPVTYGLVGLTAAIAAWAH